MAFVFLFFYFSSFVWKEIKEGNLLSTRGERRPCYAAAGKEDLVAYSRERPCCAPAGKKEPVELISCLAF